MVTTPTDQEAALAAQGAMPAPCAAAVKASVGAVSQTPRWLINQLVMGPDSAGPLPYEGVPSDPAALMAMHGKMADLHRICAQSYGRGDCPGGLPMANLHTEAMEAHRVAMSHLKSM